MLERHSRRSLTKLPIITTKLLVKCTSKLVTQELRGTLIRKEWILHGSGARSDKIISIIVHHDVTDLMKKLNKDLKKLKLAVKGKEIKLDLRFDLQGLHWELPITSDVQQWLEEDIFLHIYDRLDEFGYEWKVQYDQSFSSRKAMTVNTTNREVFVFQKRKPLATFAWAPPTNTPAPSAYPNYASAPAPSYNPL